MEKRHFNLWSPLRTIVYVSTFWFIFYLGLAMLFLPLQEYSFSLTSLVMLVSIILAAIFFERNRIILTIGKRFGLKVLYQISEWIANLSLCAFVFWFLFLFVGAYIGTVAGTEVNTALQEFWGRFLGFLILLGLFYLFFDSLSWLGKINVFFGDARKKLRSDFVKAKPWLEKGLKELEDHLIQREIAVSQRTLLYKLSILSIKNEDVCEKIKNLEDSIQNPTHEHSLYKQLVDILGDEKEIKPLQKMSDRAKRWLGGLSPYHVIYLFLIAIGLVLFLIIQKFPLPIK